MASAITTQPPNQRSLIIDWNIRAQKDKLIICTGILAGKWLEANFSFRCSWKIDLSNTEMWHRMGHPIYLIYANTNKWGINVYIIIIIIIIISCNSISATHTQILGASHKLFIACVQLFKQTHQEHTHTLASLKTIIIVPHKYDSTHPTKWNSE